MRLSRFDNPFTWSLSCWRQHFFSNILVENGFSNAKIRLLCGEHITTSLSEAAQNATHGRRETTAHLKRAKTKKTEDTEQRPRDSRYLLAPSEIMFAPPPLDRL